MITSQLLDQLVSICEEAGKQILSVYNQSGDIDVTTKGDDSPVTEADLKAHAVLCEKLNGLIEGVPVLSEESEVPPFSERSAWQAYWLIDPLDGTKEFINRNGEFTVNVALIKGGKAIAGVVHAPVLNVSYVGAENEGAWKYVEGERHEIKVRSLSSRGSEESPVEIVASRRHGAEAVEKLVDELAQRFGKVDRKSMGSSLKLCLVAEGAADIYPRLALTCEWDTAAAQAVVEAAGGAVLTDKLEPLLYNSKEELLNPFFYVLGDTSFDWNSLLKG